MIVFILNIRECIYVRGGSERVRAFPVTLAIADSTLSTTKSARKIYVFTLNIRGHIYTHGGSERVRAFPAASAIADSTLSTTKSARKIYAFTLIYVDVSTHAVVQNACARSGCFSDG